MHVEHGHATVLRNPVELLLPNLNALLLQEQEERKILRQRVRQFDVAGTARRGNPERKNRVHAVGLRLERIGVEGGAIVIRLEVVQPFEVVVHEARAETGRLPFAQVAVDARGVASEFLARPVELAVVMQIVDADFKTIFRQERAELGRDAIVALRHKVERGTKTARHLQLSQSATAFKTACALNIVGEDEREFFPVGPAAPAGGRFFRTGLDRPLVRKRALPLSRTPAPEREAQSVRHERLQPVISAEEKHQRGNDE